MNPWQEFLQGQGGFEKKQQDNPWLTVMQESQKMTREEEEEERKRRAAQQAEQNRIQNVQQDQQRVQSMQDRVDNMPWWQKAGETIARTLPGGMADVEAEQKSEERQAKQVEAISQRIRDPKTTPEQKERLRQIVSDALSVGSGSAVLSKDIQDTGNALQETGRGITDAVLQAPRIIGDGVARTLPGGLADLEAEERADEQRSNDVMMLADRIQNTGKPEQREQLKQQMADLVAEKGGLAQTLLDIKDDTNIRKFLAAAGEIGLTVATAGTGRAALTAARVGKGATAGRIVGTAGVGAAEGAGFGALTELQSDDPTTRDVLESSTIGAAFGAGIGAAISAIGAANRAIKNRPDLLEQGAKEPATLNKSFIEKIDDKARRGLENIMEPILASTPGARTKEMLGKARVALVRSEEPILNQLRGAERAGRLRDGDTRRIETLMRDVKTADQQAEYYMRDNQNWTNVIQGLDNKGLKSVSKYAEARAELDLINRGIKPDNGRAAQFQKIVDQSPPEYAQRYDSMVGYYDNLRERLVDAGIVSREQADMWANTDPNYVHIQRELDNITSQVRTSGGGGGSSLKTSRTDLKRGESVAQVKNLLETAVERTAQIEREILRNTAANEVIDGLSNVPGLLTKADGPIKNRPTISRRVNGQEETYITTPEIEAAAKSWGRVPLNAVGRILAAPTRALQSTLTGALNPAFILKSAIRDPLESFVLSRNAAATHSPTNIVGSIADAAGKSDLFKEFMRTEGSSTAVDVYRTTRNAARQLREQARLTKPSVERKAEIIKNPKEWWRRWEDVNRVQEQLGRYQNFRGAYNDAINKGATKEQALIEARWAARNNMTDFFQTGDWSPVMNAMFPYFNATVQGGMRVARGFRDKPVSTSAKVVAAVQMPAVMATMYNLSDPRRAEIYADIPEYEKENNWIFVMPGSEKTNGRWSVVKIPKPPGVGAFANPVEKMVASMYGHDPVQFGDFVQAVAKGFGSPVDISSPQAAIGSAIPQQIKPFVQGATNYDFFTGKEIVPRWLQDQESEPYKQHYENTPEIFKAIGEAIGVSPLIAQQFSKDMFGEVSRMASGTRSPSEYVSQSVASAAGGVKQRELSESFGSIVNSRGGISSQITEAVKANDLETADRLAREFNSQIDEVERMAENKFTTLTEKQRKLLSGLRVPMDGDKLSQRSIDSRKRQ